MNLAQNVLGRSTCVSVYVRECERKARERERDALLEIRSLREERG